MKKILIINPFGIGDAIFSMYLAETLRQNDPSCVIGFLCNERTKDLVRLNTSIDRTFVFNRDLFRRLWKKNPFLMLSKLRALVRALREEKFDVVFDLSLGREYSFFMIFAGIKKRIGLDYKNRGLFLTHKIKISGYSGKAVADNQLELLAFVNIPSPERGLKIPLRVPESESVFIEKELRKRQFLDGSKLIVVAPGGGRSWGRNAVFKQWDANRFAQVLNEYAKENRIKVLIIGDRMEGELLETLQRHLLPPCLVIKNEPIVRVAAYLKKAEIFLGNDGGLMHLANTLGVKTASIFGPVDEGTYAPYDKAVPQIILTEPVPCRPCYRDFHFPSCAHARQCLDLLKTDTVLEGLKKIT